ncbi:glycerophosphoryl diester phosphodiesterase membrane domain-containing protein [Streptomyces sp. NPDC002640]
MNDSPGWTSPGSSPADDPSGGRPGGQWSKEQPPPAVPPQPAPGGPHQDGRHQGGGQYPGGQQQGGQYPGGQYQGAPQPGVPPQGGPYGGGPYGGGSYGPPGAPWGPPPAPKPGVIPLRPLGLGEILDGAVTTMRTYWRPVLGISLVVAVVTQGLSLLTTLFLLDEISTTLTADPATLDGDDIASLMGQTLIAYCALLLVNLLGTTAATALLTPVTSQAVLGRPATVRHAWENARPQIWRMLGLTALIPLILLAVLAVCLLPGILVGFGGSAAGGVGLIFLGSLAALPLVTWLNFRWCLAPPALMLERQPIRQAMARSTALVKDSWWRIFGIMLLTAVITGVVSFILAIPFEILGLSLDGLSAGAFFGSDPTDYGTMYYLFVGIGGMIAQTITLPVSAGVAVLLYIDRRIRREALDLELARSAGVAPGTGS